MKISTPEYDLSTAVWFKSSFSGASGGDCVEVSAHHPGVVPVRDSKTPDGPKLAFRDSAWAAFVDGIKG